MLNRRSISAAARMPDDAISGGRSGEARTRLVAISPRAKRVSPASKPAPRTIVHIRTEEPGARIVPGGALFSCPGTAGCRASLIVAGNTAEGSSGSDMAQVLSEQTSPSARMRLHYRDPARLVKHEKAGT